MTNLEYLTLSLSPMGIEPQTIELLLKKGQLSPAGDLEIVRCDRAIYRYFSLILASTSYKRTEGAFSQSWDLQNYDVLPRSNCFRVSKCYRGKLFLSNS